MTVTLAVLAAGIPACAPTDSWTVERVVMLMRHGVRPPLHEPAVPPEITPEPWPQWDVPAGHLSGHGAEAIRLLGAADAKSLTEQGFLPASGCPDPGTVVMMSDSAERTIATGDAYVTALAPNCGVQNHHQDVGTKDPLFNEYPHAGVSAADAQRAVDQALGPEGVAGAERRVQPALDLVNRIVCGGRSGDCGPAAVPTEVKIEPDGKGRPKVSGGLGYAATIAQAVLLEYADGKPMDEVGWGRASAEDIQAMGVLHSAEFQIMARPHVLAFANAGLIARKMRDALSGRTAVTILVGHDTEIANLGGILDVHWSIPGYAEDDPAPGGAIGFEVLRDRDGERFVRTFYRAQTLEQIRSLDPGPPVRVDLAVGGCDGHTMCPIDKFNSLLEGP